MCSKMFGYFRESFTIDNVKKCSQIDKNHKQLLVLLTDLPCNLEKGGHVNNTLTRVEASLIFSVYFNKSGCNSIVTNDTVK